MKLIITKNNDMMSDITGRLIADYLKEHPSARMCLPTGGSVEGAYLALCGYLKQDSISMSDITAFNMDEYATLGRDNPNGYYYFMKQHLYSKTDIKPERTFSPDATQTDLQKACDEYTQLVEKAGKFDFTLLGIGADGHIAFNMPRQQLYLDTHIENLSAETIQANARFFENAQSVPKQAISIGVGMIMNTEKIVLVASGNAKAAALGALFGSRKLNPMLPASVLWMHPDVTFVIDEAAAVEIDRSIAEKWM